MSKVLIIDDDEIFRALVSEALSANGHTVLTAIDGEQGLKTARAERPDAIVVDLVMPKVHGYRVIERIRRYPELEDSRIIISSSSVPDTAIGQFADHFLKKPYDPDILVQLVAEIEKNATVRAKSAARRKEREQGK